MYRLWVMGEPDRFYHTREAALEAVESTLSVKRPTLYHEEQVNGRMRMRFVVAHNPELGWYQLDRDNMPQRISAPSTWEGSEWPTPDEIAYLDTCAGWLNSVADEIYS
jgi:hypothetical protein